MNQEIFEALKQFADENFNGDENKGKEFLVEYGLKNLGYIQQVKIRNQANINLGKLYGARKDFLFEIADKVFRGKYATAIFELLKIGLLYEQKGLIDKEILLIAKMKKGLDLEAMHRRTTRKKDSPFVVSYSPEQVSLIENFYEFATEKRMKISECFSYLVGTCLKIYEGLDET